MGKIPPQPPYNVGSLSITTVRLLSNDTYSLIYQVDSSELLLTGLKDLFMGTVIVDKPYFDNLSNIFNKDELNKIKEKLYELV